MSTFVAVSGHAPAPAVVVLEPHEFASSWHRRPACPVSVGLRLPSEDDIQVVRAEACREVVALDLSGDPEIDAYNDSLMSRGVARSLCNPLNVNDECPELPSAEDTITQALSPAAIRRLYDRLEKLQVEQSPLSHELDDEELTMFAYRILNGDVLTAEPAAQTLIRRFAAYASDLMTEG